MKIAKKIAILTVASTLSLFANGVENVSALVEQINNTTDAKEKSILMKKLDIEFAVMDMKEVPKAKAIIEAKLKK